MSGEEIPAKPDKPPAPVYGSIENKMIAEGTWIRCKCQNGYDINKRYCPSCNEPNFGHADGCPTCGKPW